MIEFSVRFTLLSTLSMKNRAHFEIGPMKVMVVDDEFYDPKSTSWPNQLGITVVISANSIEDAVTEAQYAAEEVASLLALSTSAAIDICRPDRAIDCSEGVKDRILWQRLRLPACILSVREFSPELYDYFHQALLNGITIGGSNSILRGNQERFARAAHWYRKGILEQELLDQYQNYWTALEAMKIILNRRYKLKNAEKVEFPCKKCGYGKKVPTEAGIKELIKRAGFKEALWSDIRKVRVDIVHGNEPLSKITPKAQALVPNLQKLVLFGLLECLNIPDEKKPQYLRDPNYFVGGPTMTVEALLPDVPKSILLPERLPRVLAPEVTTSGDGGLFTTYMGKIQLDFPSYSGAISSLNLYLATPQDPEKPVSMECKVDITTKEGEMITLDPDRI